MGRKITTKNHRNSDYTENKSTNTHIWTLLEVNIIFPSVFVCVCVILHEIYIQEAEKDLPGRRREPN